MPNRDAALAALYNRLAAAETDSSLLLTDDALRDAAELDANSDATTDLPAAQVLGWFHWNRYLTRTDPDRESDRLAAIRYFGPVYKISPASVPAAIQQAVRDYEQDSDRSDADHRVLFSQGCDLFGAYQSNRELPVLIDAITLFREALAAAPNNHRNRAAYLNNLGGTLQALFGRTGDTKTLTEAIQALREGAAVGSSNDPNRAMCLANLGGALEILFDRTGDVEALTEAVQVLREAVAATPNDDRNRVAYLDSLGSALGRLSGRTGDVDAMAEAIQVLRDAVAATPNDHPDRVRYLEKLGAVLGMLFDRTGDVEALTEAVQVLREAVAATPNDHPDRAARLADLGDSLRMLYERAGGVEALTEAVQALRDAAATTPNRAAYLNNLGNALLMLSDRTGGTDALADAVQALRDAVAATSNDSPDRARCLSNLGTALQALFDRTGDTEALTEAIQAIRVAVAAAPNDSLGRGMYLSNLGSALETLSGLTGDTEALVGAIRAGRDAVAAIPNDSPNRAAYLNNLGNALLMLSDRTGDTEALAEAVQVLRDAVAATLNDRPSRAGYLNNLGNVLRLVSERTGDTGALVEAVQVLRDAVAATPNDHPGRAAYACTLGTAMGALSERTGDTGALVEAVQVLRDAVAATPNDHPGRAMYLSNLGNALRMLSERTGDTEALVEAIRAGRDAVAATPNDSSNRAAYLNNLGNALLMLSDRTGDTEALAEAISCFQAVGGNPAAAAFVRIWGWRNTAVALTGGTDNDAYDALTAAEAAAELLPQLAPRGLTRPDREHQLGEIRFLAGVVAAAAIAAGRPERAVELLEQTRGVLVADTLDARSSDMTRLRAVVPELAKAFEKLQARMDALDQTVATLRGGPARPGTGHDFGQARREARDLAKARREAQAAWDELITRIRSVDGFADFLAAPPVGELAVQAHEGPIVFVSASPARCDALILAHDPDTPVRLVPLTDLTVTAAGEQANRLLAARRRAADPKTEPVSRMTAQSEVLDVLGWIWDTITEPVLTALGHTTTPSREESWPHVWWSPVGVLAYIPLHAAGHHADLTGNDPALMANPRTVLDRVISSYTTTVRSLAYARTRNPDVDGADAVVVTVPNAPGTRPLPGVATETATLNRLLPDALILADPTRDIVLAALPGHRVAHFACHGYADWNDPASSRLILRDHHTAPLTVANISALHLNGDLAYLSACDTTVTSPRLANEAVHITGAFHLAGYKHVIGTLWPINDALAHDITEDFYANLTSDGTTAPQTNRSARALHHAIRRLRARYPRAPTLWAGYTHTGT